MTVLIIGAGLVGSQVAKILVDGGERPLVMDQRLQRDVDAHGRAAARGWRQARDQAGLRGLQRVEAAKEHKERKEKFFVCFVVFFFVYFVVKKNPLPQIWATAISAS